MRIEDICDAALRRWAEDYVSAKIEEYRKSKRSIEPLSSEWKSWSEAEWDAFRELLELRPKAEERYKKGEIQIALSRHLQSYPKVRLNGVEYSAPYSLAREARCLRLLLRIADPPPRAIVEWVL